MCRCRAGNVPVQGWQCAGAGWQCAGAGLAMFQCRVGNVPVQGWQCAVQGWHYYVIMKTFLPVSNKKVTRLAVHSHVRWLAEMLPVGAGLEPLAEHQARLHLAWWEFEYLVQCHISQPRVAFVVDSNTVRHIEPVFERIVVPPSRNINVE